MDLPTSSIHGILENYGRNSDILKKAILGIHPPEPAHCTLEEEALPPAHRPSVQKMIEEGRKADKFKKFWRSNTGLGYYPFHR